MTRDDRLVFCKKCIKKKFDPASGIVCGLTDKQATFEDACPSFEENSNEPNHRLTFVSSIEKKRGGSLTTLFVILIAGGFVNLIGSLSMIGSTVSSVIIFLMITLNVAVLTFSFMLYNWKRVGFFGLMIAGILGSIISMSMVTILVNTLVLALVWILLFPKWCMFE